MKSYLRSHKIFHKIVGGWLLLHLGLLMFVGSPVTTESKIFPFESFDVRYYTIWQMAGYSLVLYLVYENILQRVNKSKEGDDEIFSNSDVEFVSDVQLSNRILELIKEAKKMLVLVSPYIDLSPTIKKELQLLKESRVEVFLIFGKNEKNVSRSLPLDDFELFKSFNHVHIVYVDTLHAKFYANENYMILSSMNLLEYSQVMNSECGIRIRPTSYMTDEKNKLWNDTLSYFLDLSKVGKIVFERINGSTTDNSHLYYMDRLVQKDVEGVQDFSSNPKKVGKTWFQNEEDELISLFKANTSIPQIARILDRNEGGVRARLIKLGQISE